MRREEVRDERGLGVRAREGVDGLGQGLGLDLGRRELARDGRGGVGHELGLDARRHELVLGHEGVELLHDRVADRVLELHGLGGLEQAQGLGLRARDGLELAQQRHAARVRVDDLLDRRDGLVLEGVVLRDDGLALGVEHVGDGLVAEHVRRAAEHGEDAHELGLLGEHQDLVRDDGHGQPDAERQLVLPLVQAQIFEHRERAGRRRGGRAARRPCQAGRRTPCGEHPL